METVLTYCDKAYSQEDIFDEEKAADFPPILLAFLRNWFSEGDFVEVKTSGSTGTPKRFQAQKSRMIASAKMTCSFLGLKKGDTALLCMPLQYIGAMMVVVRSIVQGLNLVTVEPSSHPLKGFKKAPDFLAVTPMQTKATLETEESLLREVKHLIIGGGAIDEPLGKVLKTFPHHVWSTYGMTETLSHIALRRLSGSEASLWYQPFEGVELSTDEHGALKIFAPSVCAETLTTNDLVEINAKGAFRILGRRDNTINTGGIKVQIEEIESQLQKVFPFELMISSARDEKFGERVVMLIAAKEKLDLEAIKAKAKEVLPKYWSPREVFQIEALPKTGSGKPARAQAKSLIEELTQS